MNINLENLVVGSEYVSDSKLCLFYIFKCIAIFDICFQCSHLVVEDGIIWRMFLRFCSPWGVLDRHLGNSKLCLPRGLYQP
jgi:hypothetical protein